MKTFRQEGESVAIVAPAGGVVAGDLVVIGSLFGVAATDAVATASVDISTEGVFELPKVVTDVVAAGAKLYWDSGLKKLTVTPGAGSKVLVGVAIQAAANGVATVEVLLGVNGITGPA